MKVIALFNLKPGVSASQYEAWARTRDMPAVRALPSVAGFEVLQTTGLLGGGVPPYAYVEIVDVADVEGFGADVRTAGMQAIAAEFATMADVIFLMTRPL